MQPIDPDLFGLLADSIVRRGADRGMIGADTLVFKILLNRNTHGGATAPYTNDEVRPETITVHRVRQSE